MTVKSSYYFTLSQSVTAPLNVNVVSVYLSQNLYSTLHNSCRLALWTITDQSSKVDSFWVSKGRKRTKFIFSNRLLWATVKRSIPWIEATAFINCRFWPSLTLDDLISAYSHSQKGKKLNASFVLKLASRGIVISLTLFYLTNIPKTPVLSAFPVLYYSQSKKPNGN